MSSNVHVTGDIITVTCGDLSETYTKRSLPDSFIQWQLRVKRERVSKDQEIQAPHGHGAVAHPGPPGADRKPDMAASMGAHIATFVTCDPESVMKLTTASKGVLLLPKEQVIDEVIERQREVLRKQYGEVVTGGEHERPTKEQWDAAEPVRLQFLEYLYQEAMIDWSVLGVLEIFEGKTLHNVQVNPECCFHFMGIVGPMGRGFQAYQINGIVQIVSEGPYLEYMRNMKLISDYYGSHVPQRQYRTGYLCYVCEVYDKNPFPQTAGKRLV